MTITQILTLAAFTPVNIITMLLAMLALALMGLRRCSIETTCMFELLFK
jgi:hypothetical protein